VEGTGNEGAVPPRGRPEHMQGSEPLRFHIEMSVDEAMALLILGTLLSLIISAYWWAGGEPGQRGVEKNATQRSAPLMDGRRSMPGARGVNSPTSSPRLQSVHSPRLHTRQATSSWYRDMYNMLPVAAQPVASSLYNLVPAVPDLYSLVPAVPAVPRLPSVGELTPTALYSTASSMYTSAYEALPELPEIPACMAIPPIGDKISEISELAGEMAAEPLMKASACLACCLPTPPSTPEASSQHADPSSVISTAATAESELTPWTAPWEGLWIMTGCELEKSDEVMRKQGCPYLIRKVLQRFRSERQLHVDEEGHLVLSTKTITGGWLVMSSATGTEQVSSFFGYEFLSVMSWEGVGEGQTETMVTTCHVTDPSGKTSVATSRHWVDGETLVAHSESPEGEYKTYFSRVTQDSSPSTPPQRPWKNLAG